MDKTTSISLGGFAFIIDDSAYLQLKNYLEQIRRSLKGMEGTEDIISDVETRIAELLKNNLNNREVINENDVNKIIEIMGRPEQFVEDDDNEELTQTKKTNYNNANSNTKKKLYRDPNDIIIGGVASGISHYLGIEPWIVRVAWVLLMFIDLPFTGTAFTTITYIILWIILPKAQTATERFEMYGEKGDFESIKKNASQTAKEMKGMAGGLSKVIGQIFQTIGKIILFFIGFMLIFMGFSMIISAVVLFVMASAGMPFQLFDAVIGNDLLGITFKVLSVILVTIPGILLIILGFRIFSSRFRTNKTFIASALVVWFISLIGTSIIGVNMAGNFVHEIEYSDKKNYTITQDTIAVQLNTFKNLGEKKYKWLNSDFSSFAEFDGQLHREIHQTIEVRESDNNQTTVEVIYESKGKNIDEARTNAEKITYNYTVDSLGIIQLNQFLSLPKNSPFRDQDVSIVLHIPKNKVIYAKNANLTFYNAKEDSYNYEYNSNKFYKFDSFGKAFCLNCKNKGNFEDETLNDDEDNNLKIMVNGVEILQNEINDSSTTDSKKEIIINNKHLKIKNGTDSINIDFDSN